MDLADIALEYDELVSAISVLEKRREELRNRILNTFDEKGIDILRIGNVELKRRRVDWKLWKIRKLKSYLQERELWDMVESVDRKTLSKLIERGFLTEQELEGMYDIEPRYSLHVNRV
ncbi:hypothetical protein [Methanosarcina mazei]|jgi:hypothetical protein|uniref:Uncharacterized protein n=2 Tax=Methanosarcina mazei TaxID=2209 RepID=A0A0F8HI77_METMZ|nr:hypothetical protein [Methanosarcina mazei]AKB72461.1 hypothetical protein MSMAC_2571 [Methanosarcina mazei C16]KKF97664.1 hypothetical protein DU47_00020 [Methanosarcina mazei]KKG12433.1 hypothetical protein DU34_15925 [Methanosarcina mazei]KKG30989.1 hypothetical protein DU49_03920 [Methanosarcina mazei]KKG32691.1 hypothetical protein DU52_02905 [Methanosarcina mazei]